MIIIGKLSHIIQLIKWKYMLKFVKKLYYRYMIWHCEKESYYFPCHVCAHAYALDAIEYRKKYDEQQ